MNRLVKTLIPRIIAVNLF